MPIEKNYLNSKLKGLRDNNITPLDDNNLDNNNLNNNNLNKLLLNDEDFNNRLGKA
jgi:hypothetical protein